MLKFYLFVLLSVASISGLYAQKVTLQGKIKDTANKTNLADASVIVLKAKDSILYSFARTDKNSSFRISNVDTGNYILLVTYPNYADYTEAFTINTGEQSKDFGDVDLITKTALLTDVIVHANTAIRIKGDTTEFTADSFKVDVNANVEELLKRLPGFQVDQNGNITAQGQTIKKVLVDGEEFFGDDPTLVTKNIKASMVDKVQLYDKTSDQAAFTGIDDGVRDKTVNIKLKDDQKKGYFGKIDVGGGAEDLNKGKGYYYGQTMFNSFKSKRKFSAYGTFANTGDVGLNWSDAMKYGSSGANMEVTDDGGIMFMGSGGDSELDWGGRYDGNGYPDVQSGGLHYDNKWNEDKQFINGNYKIGRIAKYGSSNTLTQNNLPDRVIFSESNNNYSSNLFRQKADAVYELKPDTSSMFKISASGSLANTSSDNHYETLSRREDSSMLNDNKRDLSNEGVRNSFGANMYYQRKFKKKGRTISGNIATNIFDENTHGNLLSNSNFYDSTNAIINSQTIDQLKDNNSKSSNITSKVMYTEPLNEQFTLVSNYGYNIYKSNSARLSYNKDAEENYSKIDSTYSNRYAFDQYNHRGGMALNYKKNKIVFNVGTDLSAVNYKQTDLFRNRGSLERNFVNWFPSARFSYRASQQKRLEVNYNGNTNQPSINQLQPLFVNDDPLNIFIGNPELRPSFRHSLNASYFTYKVMTERAFGFWGNYQMTMNPIVTNVLTDDKGVNTYKYFNLKENYNPGYNLSIWYGRKFPKLWDIRYSVDIETRGNEYVNYINDVLNKTTSSSYGIVQRLDKYKNDAYDFGVSYNLSYNINKSSLQERINNNGFSYTLRGNLRYYITKKFIVRSDAQYFWQQKTVSFNENFERFTWDAYLIKKFGKKDNMQLILTAKDILNQNNGFSRSAYNNTITQKYNTTIGRHMLLSFVYDFNKAGAGASK